eukprot:COSAG02_NODE_5851_length_3989_cov_1.620308_3_plen_69_part_00
MQILFTAVQTLRAEYTSTTIRIHPCSLDALCGTADSSAVLLDSTTPEDGDEEIAAAKHQIVNHRPYKP